MIISSMPTAGDFFLFWGEDPDDWDSDRANLFIQLAAELLWLATDLDSDPSDARLQMLIKYAICDMAVFLYVSREDIGASYSPFNSEKIGSYSYSKQFSSVQKRVMTNEPTGVPFFDKVVQYLADDAMYSGGLVTSEEVFHTGYQPLRYQAWGFSRYIDPAMPIMSRRYLYSAFGNADDDEGTYYP